MRSVRKSIRLSWIAVVLVLALGVVLAASHRPDRDTYLEYVATYGDYNNLTVPAVSEEELIAAGERACGWLRVRQPALWRTDRQWEVNSLYQQYSRTLSEADAELPKAFVPGAFSYLCPLSTYLHKPHRIRSQADSD